MSLIHVSANSSQLPAISVIRPYCSVAEQENSGSSDSSGDELSGRAALYNISSKSDKPIMVDVSIEGIDVSMELDTGSGKTIISEKHVQGNIAFIEITQVYPDICDLHSRGSETSGLPTFL